MVFNLMGLCLELVGQKWSLAWSDSSVLVLTVALGWVEPYPEDPCPSLLAVGGLGDRPGFTHVCFWWLMWMQRVLPQ